MPILDVFTIQEEKDNDELYDLHNRIDILCAGLDVLEPLYSTCGPRKLFGWPDY